MAEKFFFTYIIETERGKEVKKIKDINSFLQTLQDYKNIKEGNLNLGDIRARVETNLVNLIHYKLPYAMVPNENIDPLEVQDFLDDFNNWYKKRKVIEIKEKLIKPIKRLRKFFGY